MTELPPTPETEQRVSDLTIGELALKVAMLAEFAPHKEALIVEAAKQLGRLNNLTVLISDLAPSGTAPRTALDQLWRQAESNSGESASVIELRRMLKQHWGEWTLELAQAAGFSLTDESKDQTT